MKKTTKYFASGIVLSLLCSAFVVPSAMAVAPAIAMPKGAIGGPVESPTEFVGVLAMYVQKLEKISAYKEEIQKTLDVKKTFGELDINAASEMLAEGSGCAKAFQESLQFAEDVASDSKAYVSKASNTLSDAKSTASTAISGVKSTASTAANKAAETQSSNAETSGSAVSRVTTLSAPYGVEQSSIEEAQKYVKNAFFYSAREGDKLSGEPLSETDQARKKVIANRSAYYREVVSSGYGQATEAIKTNYDAAQKRMADVMKKAESAQTYDEKKAVETAIMQNDTRERMTRLSLELAILEQETVSMLIAEPEDYLIPRSPDEIRAETKELVKDVDFKKEGSSK